MVKIHSVAIQVKTDEYADTSWLGEWTDKLGPGIIVRCLGDYYERLPAPMERDFDGRFYAKGEPFDLPAPGREYRGFRPYAGGEKVGTKNYYKYGMQDGERMEGLCQGDWSFIGIFAEAVVKYPCGRNGREHRIETLRSGGLWGIESDAGREHIIDDVVMGELADLKQHLEAFNVDLSDFDAHTKAALHALDSEYLFS